MTMFSMKQTGLYALKLEKEKRKRREIRKSIIRKRVRKFEKEIFRDEIFENDYCKDEIKIDGVSLISFNKSLFYHPEIITFTSPC